MTPYFYLIQRGSLPVPGGTQPGWSRVYSNTKATPIGLLVSH